MSIPILHQRAPIRLRKESGFTLIELIAVIAIVAVLAASALPRYIDLGDEAHQAAVAGTAGAFRGAIFLANAACYIRGFAGMDNLPNFGAGNVDFNANCLPASTNGNNSLNVNANRCLQIWGAILQPAPPVSTLANDDTDYLAQGGGTNCTYSYRDDDDTLRGFTYNAATGQITIFNP